MNEWDEITSIIQEHIKKKGMTKEEIKNMLEESLKEIRENN